MRMHDSTFLLVTLVTMSVAIGQTSTLVLPNGAATVEGNSSNALPWGNGGAGLLHQCVYDSSHFTLQGINSPILITRLRWRPDTGVGLLVTNYPTACSVRLSTCPVDWNATTTTFAAQRGTDETLCYQGPVSFGPQAAQVGPTPFGIDIPLTTPFFYDPNAGDLNIECDIPVQGVVGGPPPLDVNTTLGQAKAARIYATAGSYTGYPGGTALGRDVNHAVVVEVGYTTPGSFANQTPYGTGCVDQPEASSYELFAPSAAFDLSNSAISLVRTEAGYTAVPGFTSYVPPSPTAAILPLGDDSEITVTLSTSMPFGRNGSTNQLAVCSNGFLSPATGNGTGFTPVAAAFLGSAQLWWSLCWHDYNPSIPSGGRIKFEESGGFAYVTWDGVWDFGGTSSASANTMQAQFDLATGNVHFAYQTMSALGNTRLVGVSDAGVSANPGSMDISAALPATYQAMAFLITPVQQTASARPVLGTSIALTTTNASPTALLGLTLFGTTQFLPGIDLTSLGMPSCKLYCSLDSTAPIPLSSGAGSFVLSIPSTAGLAGFTFYTQGAAFDPGVNAFGFLISNGIRLRLDIL